MKNSEMLMYDNYLTDNNALCSYIEQLSDNIDMLSTMDEWKLLQLFENMFDIFMIKQNRNYFPRSDEIIHAIIAVLHPASTPYISDILCKRIQKNTRFEKEYCYKAFKMLIETNPNQIKICMPKLISIISSDVNDINTNVKKNASETLELLLHCSGNNDLHNFIPIVLKGLKDYSSIYDAVESLASCVFVQNVEAPALAITTPILLRGLNDKKTITKRLTCVIIDNMCKLIEHPKEILPFYAQLKIKLEFCTETISDPEARKVSERALNTLKSACSVDENSKFIKTVEEMTLLLENELATHSIIITNRNAYKFMVILVTNMCNGQFFELEEWRKVFEKYIPNEPNVKTVAETILKVTMESFTVKEEHFEDTEEGKDLYKGTFSLAYGALTLLNNTHLHLKQNRFYGLLGPNNCGKTTLMRAIANEQVEGFPKKDELKTIFVEHEIKEMEVGEDERGFPILNIDLCGADWVVHCCNVIYEMRPLVTRGQVEVVMEEIGFGNAKKDVGKDRAADMEMGVTTYSGGWKMKMQLCAATLMNADILMLDEPTGHLDVTNIAWIKKWLSEFIQKGGSIITTSHDSTFLNEMCTHLIDFQNRKLKMFTGKHGNVLSEFVEKFPEKKGYFELKNNVVKFTFPEPGPLEGIKSLSKTLMKMKNVTYQYPSRDTPTIFDVNIECSRVSRVGVIGANGAGKSTAIKILIGELKPTKGEVTKHPDMRTAYIAQHAFHHLEKHLQKTPTQYIMWRFAGNEDKEGIDMINAEETEENKIIKYYISTLSGVMELRMCSTPQEEKQAVELDSILTRRENKKIKVKEYEVKWKHDSSDNTMWIKREILLKMGAKKMVQRHDEKEAVMAGIASKNLTTKDIEKHFANFGIDPEQANHTLIKSLSGGQKVKVVLAASLWQNPHLIILDEPTNYLDRDGLGALTNAIYDYKGGVVIISHNREFTSAIAQEKWIMEKGLLRREGESLVSIEEKEKNVFEEVNKTVFDALGNEIKVETKVKLTEKELKREIKSLHKKLKDGKKKGLLNEDEILEIEDKLDELQGNA
jgi:elongation factor 3